MRKWRALGALVLLTALMVFMPSRLAADSTDTDTTTIPIRGDRLSGFVLPIEPLTGPITIRARRADVWRIDDTQRLLLHSNVQVSIAGHRFRATNAVVWLNRIPSQWGTINQIAIYFDEVSNPTRQAGTGVSGRNVLVTGSTIGEVNLDVVRLDKVRPSRTGLLQRGEARLAEHLRQVAGEPPPLARRPQIKTPAEPEIYRPEPGRRFTPEVIELPKEIELPVEEPAPWLVPPTGTVRYAANEIEIVPGEDENTISMVGPLVVEYVAGDRADRWERITISAERGVIFTDPGPLEAYATGQLTAQSIRGVYLEGNVIVRADEDDYTIRSPQVYYDFRTSQAIMVDAILRTYSREEDLLVYSRAKEMRQISENQWVAEQVRVSTSEFFTPHIAVGARRATVTQRPSRTDPRRSETHLKAEHITLRAGTVPFFWWPGFSGTLQETPLESVVLGNRRNDGVRLETTWNLLSLMNIEAPPGVEVDLKVDGFSKRGAGVGTELRYRDGGSRGTLELYGMRDDGIDRASTGVNVDSGETYRGLGLWEHHMRLGQDWIFQGQASWISDPTFISQWRWDDFGERREYETSAYLKHQSENAAFTVLGKYALNDFISNDYLIASQPYQVEKLPEVTYRRLGDSLFRDTLTYHSEFSVSRMRMIFVDTTVRESGLRNGTFGLGPDDRIDEMLRAQGLRQNFVNRADTRHELSLPFEWNIFRIVPFIVGRVTAYDDEFEAFSEETDKTRWYGAAGITIGTQFQRVFNDVENQLFDLHRLRHVIEPSVTLWHASTNLTGADLPVFDPDVEPLADGTAMRVGMRNTWQTQRGGPGRWRSVDVLTLDANLVLHSSDADRRSPTPRFFDYRPEFSQPGDHLSGMAAWQISDALIAIGQTTYDLDEDLFARVSVGTELQHSPTLTTYVEYRFIEASSNELLDVRWSYQLTPKYRVSVSPQWDFRRDELRSISTRLTRRFPDFDLILFLRYDSIRDETDFGATIGTVRF